MKTTPLKGPTRVDAIVPRTEAAYDSFLNASNKWHNGKRSPKAKKLETDVPSAVTFVLSYYTYILLRSYILRQRENLIMTLLLFEDIISEARVCRRLSFGNSAPGPNVSFLAVARVHHHRPSASR